MSRFLPDRSRTQLRAFDTRFCTRCHCQRRFSKRTAAHLWHFGLTIATFGLWGIAWLTVSILESQRPWRCSECDAQFTAEAEH
jgi:hypothetical protein